MSNWTPTNELRFVKRLEGDIVKKPVRILQQKWEVRKEQYKYKSEWRDVPVESEE